MLINIRLKSLLVTLVGLTMSCAAMQPKNKPCNALAHDLEQLREQVLADTTQYFESVEKGCYNDPELQARLADYNSTPSLRVSSQNIARFYPTLRSELNHPGQLTYALTTFSQTLTSYWVHKNEARGAEERRNAVPEKLQNLLNTIDDALAILAQARI